MGAHSLLRARPDLTAVADACYAQATDDRAWARGIIDAIRPAVSDRCGVGFGLVEHSLDCCHVRPRFDLGPGGEAFVPDELAALRPDWFRDYFFFPALVATHSDVERSWGADDDVRAYMDGLRRAVGADDVLGLIAHPEPGIALVLYLRMARGAELTRYDRARLERLALHVESGFRVRQRSLSPRAVLTAQGRWLEGDPGRDGASFLDAARRVDDARAANDLDPWTALVGGEVSIVPRMRGSRRVYELVDNAIASRPFRALDKRELDVLRLAARGLPSKLCAYTLGISDTAVSRSLAGAAAKLGLASRIELLRVAALLARDPRVDAPATELTAAEADVLALLREGLTNTAIAARRHRSVRTIANQVSSLLRKTGASSRRELAVRV